MTGEGCKIEGCGKRTVGRGLCQSHYYKAKRDGTIDELSPSPSGPCEHCGEAIPPGRRWGARFCSTDCKQAAQDAATSAKRLAIRNARPRFCAWCKDELPAEKKSNARVCSVKCGNNWQNHQKALAQKRAVLAARPPCEVCGGPIPEGRHGHAVYCSTECKRSAGRSDSPQARERKFDENLRRIYGVTTQDYQRMLAEQSGCCAICGTDEPGGKGSFHVDHCHDSSRVRGLLCHRCNIGLGQFKDDPVRLPAAIDYLSRMPHGSDISAAGGGVEVLVGPPVG
jgi:hypothetical protein